MYNLGSHCVNRLVFYAKRLLFSGKFRYNWPTTNVVKKGVSCYGEISDRHSFDASGQSFDVRPGSQRRHNRPRHRSFRQRHRRSDSHSHGPGPRHRLAHRQPTRTAFTPFHAFRSATINSKVEAKGFKTNLIPAFTLEVNQRARFDVRMEVGGMTETVTVTAEAALLQTDTTQVGAVITAQTIVNTPLISRNPIALTLLAAGVTTPNPAGFNTGQRTTGGGRPYVNGNREEGNNFLLDGVDNNQTSDNLTSYQPNLDAIAEFKMITNNASAEFGNFQGGIMNVVIKSGTNQFHGNVFEYFRNDKLNANNWGRNWTVDRTSGRRSAGTSSAARSADRSRRTNCSSSPIIRRSGAPRRRASSATTIMPAAWRKGDFSNLLDPKYSGVAGGIQLYNPFSVDASTATARSLREQPDSGQPLQPGDPEAVRGPEHLSAADALHAERRDRYELLLHAARAI